MTERKQYNTVEELKKDLTILYFAFLAGLVWFAGITWFLAPVHLFAVDIADPLFIVAIVLTATMIPVGHILFQNRIAAARTADTISEKLNIYRQGFIFRCATLEAPALFSLICCFLTNMAPYYLFFLVILVVFATVNPTVSKIRQQIGVTD